VFLESVIRELYNLNMTMKVKLIMLGKLMRENPDLVPMGLTYGDLHKLLPSGHGKNSSTYTTNTYMPDRTVRKMTLEDFDGTEEGWELWKEAVINEFTL